MTAIISSSLCDTTERVSCEGDHLGPSYKLRRATQLATLNILLTSGLFQIRLEMSYFCLSPNEREQNYQLCKIPSGACWIKPLAG